MDELYNVFVFKMRYSHTVCLENNVHNANDHSLFGSGREFVESNLALTAIAILYPMSILRLDGYLCYRISTTPHALGHSGAAYSYCARLDGADICGGPSQRNGLCRLAADLHLEPLCGGMPPDDLRPAEHDML